MNWGQFNDFLCYLCLHGAVLAFPSLTKKMVVQIPFRAKNITNSVDSREFNCEKLD